MAFLRSTLIPLLAAALGILTTVIAGRLLYDSEQTAVETEFERRSQIIANVIELQVRINEDTLYSLRSMFHFSDDVSRTQFAGAASDLMRDKGMLALNWATRVPRSQRAPLETAIRMEGFPNFELTDLGPGPARPRAPDRPEHFPIIYVHPYALNKESMGIDLVSSLNWAELQRAASDNLMVVSELLPLITDGQRPDRGCLLELPVYYPPVPDKPEARRQQLRGYVIGVFRPADVVEAAMKKLRHQGVDVLVSDPLAPADRQILHWHPSRTRTAPLATPSVAEMTRASSHLELPLRVAGRNWAMHFRPTPEWLAAQQKYYWVLVLAGGILGSLLLGIYLRGTLRRTDIIEQQVAARTAELRASEARLQAILDQCPSLIFVKDLENRYLLVNEPFAKLCGCPVPQILGRMTQEFFPPQDAAVYLAHDRRVLETGHSLEFEETLHTPEGIRTRIVQRFPLLDPSGRAYAICGVSTDISERKQAEADKLAFERNLLETQKLESLGIMAGGIAHDFNNILTAVLANASLARMTLKQTDSGQANLEQIENAARRAADLCSQMLAYAGKGKILVGPIDLSNLVRDTATMLEVSVGKKCELALDLARNLPPVLGDAAQLGQIVMNLVINGADAIGDRSGGQITVTTFVREADAALFSTALHKPELEPGLYVGLEVRDNGCGIPPETISRIFEPFFTTKFSGRGLGLSAVIGIVQSHQGALFVESQPGVGSTFRLLLPTAAAAQETRPAAAPVVSPQPLRGTVLVVDDEEAVRWVAGEVLRRNGATVLEAADGTQGIELFRQHRESISLILLDLTMPGLSGEDVLRQLQRLGVRQQIVVMSGYSEEDTMRRCAELGVAGFLRKPFELSTLVARLQAYLP